MAKLLKGAAVVETLNENLKDRITKLKAKGITPTLAIVEVGEDPKNSAYKKGATKRGESLGLKVEQITCPGDITKEDFKNKIKEINGNDNIHGVLVLKPLPAQLDDDDLNILEPKKDVDGITMSSAATVFLDGGEGYPPCTPQGCMETLDYYDIELAGKNVVVVGRSPVVGKPVSMMLLKRNATVTICHSKTENLKGITKTADIIVVAMGREAFIDKSFVSPGQVVIDVGINFNKEGKLCGDVSHDVEEVDLSMSPVPGGIGSVTTSVLVKHVVEAAEKTAS